MATTAEPIWKPTAFRLPWGTTPEGEYTRNGMLLASYMGTLAVFTTLPLGLIGIGLSCWGLDAIPRQDPRAEKRLVWSWILFGPGTVVGTAVIIYFLWTLLSSALS